LALLAVFFAFAAGFFVAIQFTTFHAVRDLTVAPTWQKSSDFSDILTTWFGEASRREIDCSRSSLTVTRNSMVFSLVIFR
jgi:hypothetical protein